MSQAEFLEWAQYLTEVPGGDEWANWRAALVASTVAQASCGKRANQFPIKDFMPTPVKDKPKPEASDPAVLMKILTQMFHAKPKAP